MFMLVHKPTAIDFYKTKRNNNNNKKQCKEIQLKKLRTKIEERRLKKFTFPQSIFTLNKNIYVFQNDKGLRMLEN